MNKKYILIAIFIIASFLRFWKLGSNPPSPSLDEVSIGWNAYSIAQTGVDEFGTKFPLILRAYDDWRPALYVYAAIPFVKLFGLTAWSVRTPSVLLSIGVVILTYLITSILFQDKNIRLKVDKIDIGIPEISTLLLSISPWHIYLSRLGHEANLGLFFSVLAVYFFIKYLYGKQEKTSLILSAIIFSLSMYSYQSQKLVTPVVILSLFILYFKKLIKDKKTFITAFLVFVFMSLPLAYITLGPNGLTRLEATSVLNIDYRSREQLEAYAAAVKEYNPVVKIINSPKIYTAKIIISNYMSHFNPSWLFWGTGEESHKVPFLGLLYVWELPFLLIGLYWLIKRHQDKKAGLMLLVLILSAPLPAAITTQAPHAMRSYTVLPYLQIITGLGFLYSASWFKKSLPKSVYFTVFRMIFLVSIFIFYQNYFINFPLIHSKSFQFAANNAMAYVSQTENNYDKVIFSNVDNLYQSYMFYLFNAKYDPNLYQNLGGTVSGGYEEVHKFGKFEFRPIVWETDSKISNSLIVGNIEDVVIDNNLIEIFDSLDGTPGVFIVKTL